MHQSRIEILREKVAEIGSYQAEFQKSCHLLADDIESGFGDYIGDRSCVALCIPTGEFSFECGSYRHQGLSIANGRFHIPLMIRIPNLPDVGELLLRIHLFLSPLGERLSCELNGCKPFEFSKDDLAPLYEYVFSYIDDVFTKENWLNYPSSDYSATAIGFRSEK